jgi:hypothetical protein
MTSRQLGRRGTTVLLGADEAVVGFSEDRGVASWAIASAVILGQIFKVVLSSARSEHTMAHKSILGLLAESQD